MKLIQKSQENKDWCQSTFYVIEELTDKNQITEIFDYIKKQYGEIDKFKITKGVEDIKFETYESLINEILNSNGKVGSIWFSTVDNNIKFDMNIDDETKYLYVMDKTKKIGKPIEYLTNDGTLFYKYDPNTESFWRLDENTKEWVPWDEIMSLYYSNMLKSIKYEDIGILKGGR